MTDFMKGWRRGYAQGGEDYLEGVPFAGIFMRFMDSTLMGYCEGYEDGYRQAEEDAEHFQEELQNGPSD